MKHDSPLEQEDRILARNSLMLALKEAAEPIDVRALRSIQYIGPWTEANWRSRVQDHSLMHPVRSSINLVEDLRNLHWNPAAFYVLTKPVSRRLEQIGDAFGNVKKIQWGEGKKPWLVKVAQVAFNGPPAAVGAGYVWAKANIQGLFEPEA